LLVDRRIRTNCYGSHTNVTNPDPEHGLSSLDKLLLYIQDNGSGLGLGLGRPKQLRMLRIQIGNTGCQATTIADQG
jgi:hypothetical protein